MTMKNGFDSNFLFGGAICSSQAEGAYNEGGKGLDTQDLRYFDPSWTKEERKLIPNRRLNHEKFTKALTDKDISHYPFRHGIDFYHQWESDLDLFQELGLRIFRTSVCWARIYPNGDDEKPNEEGLRYYHDLFQGCHDRGIKVFVTILHYNIPLNLLQKYGGWRSRETIKYYEKYARTLFQYLGDVVDYWLPFNEFNAGKFNPYNGVCILEDDEDNTQETIFQCLHNQFIANALAIKACHEMLSGKMIGGMIARFTSYPATCKPEDVMQSITDEQYSNWFYLDVMARGKYPKYMERFFEHSGVTIKMEPGDIELIKNNTVDLCRSHIISHRFQQLKMVGRRPKGI